MNPSWEVARLFRRVKGMESQGHKGRGDKGYWRVTGREHRKVQLHFRELLNFARSYLCPIY